MDPITLAHADRKTLLAAVSAALTISKQQPGGGKILVDLVNHHVSGSNRADLAVTGFHMDMTADLSALDPPLSQKLYLDGRVLEKILKSVGDEKLPIALLASATSRDALNPDTTAFASLLQVGPEFQIPGFDPAMLYHPDFSDTWEDACAVESKFLDAVVTGTPLTDPTEQRAHILGVLMSEEQGCFMATNGRALMRYTATIKTPSDILLPKKSIATALTVFGRDKTITIQTSPDGTQSRLSVANGATEIMVSNVDGTGMFPDTSSLFEHASKACPVRIVMSPLHDVLKKASAISTGAEALLLTGTADGFKAELESAENGSFSHIGEITLKDCPDLTTKTVAYNPDLLKRCFSGFTCEELPARLDVSHLDNSPLFCEHDGLAAVIMPLKP